jgi:bifunctional DNA-binding transcriptional regulator/antitoxin component of YhaV-PrlF toxin-antitoxin module
MKKLLNLTSRGVVTLPARMREAAGFPPNGQILAEITQEGLLLRPAVALPVEIYSTARVAEFDQAEAELDKALRRKKQR